MSTEKPFDVAVVGAGPGGYVAAIRAAQLGARVCLIERDAVGGTCLNKGCIPTKALVASVSAYQTALQASSYGVVIGEVKPDFTAMMKRSESVVNRLVKGVEFLLRKNKIQLIQGRASFSGTHSLQVRAGGQVETIEATNIILATGSKPMVFPNLSYDAARVITSDEVVRLDKLPSHLVIIGGGVIGCEYASIFNSLGTEVTIVEALPAILPMIDKDISRQLGSFLKRRGITLLTGTKVDSIIKGHELQVQLANGSTLACDLALIAVGRRANTTGLGLAEVGVKVNSKGEIVVDDHMRTSIPHVYAIGDATNIPWKLAHVASRQGIIAAHQCMGQDETADYSAVPSVVFTEPEVASVGLTSEEAASSGITLSTAKLPFIAIGKAVADGHTDGFVKILAEKDTDRLVGVHIIGPHADTLIAEATLAVQQKLTAKQLVSTIHAHPTLAEAILEAAEGVHGQSIHV